MSSPKYFEMKRLFMYPFTAGTQRKKQSRQDLSFTSFSLRLCFATQHTVGTNYEYASHQLSKRQFIFERLRAHLLFVEDEHSGENLAATNQMQNDDNCLCFPQTLQG